MPLICGKPLACRAIPATRRVKAHDAGIGDEVLNALFGVVAAVNAGVAAATAREGHRMAAEADQPQCDEICSATPAARRGLCVSGRLLIAVLSVLVVASCQDPPHKCRQDRRRAVEANTISTSTYGS